jgi:AcrR family transcriptional regulator
VSVGRPPDPEADERIIAAAQKLLATKGFARLSIEGVAAESGVAKTTIYRRFSDRVDLATAAISALMTLAVPEPTGDAYEDVLAQLEFNRRKIDTELVGTLLGEEARSPQLLALFRERVLLPRSDIFRGILTAGIESGQLRVDLDFDAVRDLVLGAFLAHYLIEGRPAQEWPRRVIDAVWPAVRAA